MRRLLLSTVTAGLCVGVVLAGGQDEPRAILDKAIKAHGGEAHLKKFTAGIIKAKGRLEVAGGLDITQEISFQLPDKMREEGSFEIMGTPVKTVTIFDGKKGNIEVNGKKVDLGDKLDRALRDGVQMLDAFKLYPLLDKAYELSVFGEAKVNDQPAIGIRAVKKGHPDMTLFFDKKTHLLVKAEHRTIDVQSGDEVTQERIISEYQKVDGVPQPKKVLVIRDGKKFLEAEVVEMKNFEKLDNERFTIPR
jgi:hypothetical protein